MFSNFFFSSRKSCHFETIRKNILEPDRPQMTTGICILYAGYLRVEWKRNLVAHGEAWEEKWRGKRRMEWVASSLALYRKTVYPALLPTIKTCDSLASSMLSRELRSKIRQFQHHCFHITLNYCWHSEFSCFPYYDIYLSTATVLTPGCCSTVHNNTQKCWPCPVFASYTLAFALQLRNKNGNTSGWVAKGC